MFLMIFRVLRSMVVRLSSEIHCSNMHNKMYTGHSYCIPWKEGVSLCPSSYPETLAMLEANAVPPNLGRQSSSDSVHVLRVAAASPSASWPPI